MSLKSKEGALSDTLLIFHCKLCNCCTLLMGPGQVCVPESRMQFSGAPSSLERDVHTSRVLQY